MHHKKANTASNTVNSVNTSNAGVNDSTVNYVKNQISSGKSYDDVIRDLSESGYSEEIIAQIFANAGL